MRAVALMDVEVDDRRARDPARALERPHGDGDVVEDAESLAVIGEGVMGPPGKVDRDTVAQRRVGGLTGAANRAEGALDEVR